MSSITMKKFNHNSLNLIGEDSPYTHEEADATIMSYLLNIQIEKELYTDPI